MKLKPSPAPRRRNSASEPRACAPASNPAAGRLLHGSLADLGVSVEAHEFKDAFDWGRTFHPGTLQLCLNWSGCGVVRLGESRIEFTDRTVGLYLPGNGGLRAARSSGGEHRFVTFTFSQTYLRRHLSACDGALNPLVEQCLATSGDVARLGPVRRMTPEQEQSTRQLFQPSVPHSARALWYSGKALELMAEVLFERPAPDELFCDRQKRVARERADRVIVLLQKHLAEPLALGALAREVGCSPFYLSRIFSQQTNMTIPQYLRKLRMERAAELLRSGRYNVTEAAMEVGYSSLSHFSQAFCQTMGCCPALYPFPVVANSAGAQGTAKE